MQQHQPDVALANEDTCMVERLREILLEHQSLKAATHDVSSLDTQHIIQLALVLIKKTQTRAAAEKSLTLENTLGILLIESEKISSGFTHLGQHNLNTPNLTLVFQAEFPDNFHLTVQALLLEGTPRSLRGLGVCHSNQSVSTISK